MMLIVPRQPTVRLTYARTASDNLGLLLTGGAVLGALFAVGRRRYLRTHPRPAPAVPPISLDECDAPAPTRRWGAAIPGVFLLGCAVARAAAMRPVSVDPMP